jgi:hypothetical protein
VEAAGGLGEVPGASDGLGRLGAVLGPVAFPLALVSVVVVVVTLPLGEVLLPLGLTLPPSSDWIRPSSLPSSATAQATIPANGPPACERTAASSSAIPASISASGVGAAALGWVTLVPLFVPLMYSALLPSPRKRVEAPVIRGHVARSGEVGQFADPGSNVHRHRLDTGKPPCHRRALNS